MARTTIRTEDITASAVTAAKIASGAVDTTGLEDDIALLGFKVASNGSLAKYNLVDQTVDDFQDTSGVDASASTDEVRDASGKYYSGQAGGTDPTGGTETTVGDYKYHSFTSTGANNFIVAGSGTVEVLMIAGGGGGGAHHGGGGGAGAAANDTALAVTAQTYALSVGVQGAASTSGTYGGDGGDSTGFGWTLKGGGGGADYQNKTGAAGGCAGGGSGESGAGGTTNQGSYTQTSGTRTVYESDGGSRGDGAAEGWGGGIGTDEASRTISNFSQFGVSGAFGGGGGCGNNAGTGTGGGAGAGDGGGNSQNGDAASTQNTGSGGGGGGGGGDSYTGGAGASGWIGVRYATDAFLPPCDDMTLVSTTTAAQAAPTKGDIVLTYTNGAGTTTLDTDLTAEISADGGSTWTALALGSEGSTGSHNIATSHDVTISSTITAPWNMAYRIKTLNQGASKTTRIQAVSLGWS